MIHQPNLADAEERISYREQMEEVVINLLIDNFEMRVPREVDKRLMKKYCRHLDRVLDDMLNS